MDNFEFVAWDWKEQPDFKKINEILTEIQGPVRIQEVETGGDYYLIAVHSSILNLTEEEWEKLWGCEHRKDFTADVYKMNNEELHSYLSKLTEEEEE